MDPQRVDMWMMTNGKHLDPSRIPYVRERLLAADESKWSALQMVQLKDPTTMLIVSLFGGSLGIDRFMLGSTGVGVAKLLTCGGLGIWGIVDWFLIMNATRERNFALLQPLL